MYTRIKDTGLKTRSRHQTSTKVLIKQHNNISTYLTSCKNYTNVFHSLITKNTAKNTAPARKVHYFCLICNRFCIVLFQEGLLLFSIISEFYVKKVFYLQFTLRDSSVVLVHQKCWISSTPTH